MGKIENPVEDQQAGSQRAAEMQSEIIADQMAVILQNFANSTLTREQAKAVALNRFEEILDSSLNTIRSHK